MDEIIQTPFLKAKIYLQIWKFSARSFSLYYLVADIDKILMNNEMSVH